MSATVRLASTTGLYYLLVGVFGGFAEAVRRSVYAPGCRGDHEQPGEQGPSMITIDRLTKKYGTTLAVDDVSFTAAAGRVTGFLGPNGAGKSTTMRIMVGLTRATMPGPPPSPGATTWTCPTPGSRSASCWTPRPSTPDAPAGRSSPWPSSSWACRGHRVEEMLETVSLTPTEASRRVGEYSLGMRQRLGIATALIGDPEVLILDEPANGLDPAGIRWMRDLLRGYADRGGTVLLSSHLLHEIEVIADDIVMIGLGRIVSRAPRPTCSTRPAPSSAPPTCSRSSSRLTASGLDRRPRPTTARCAPTRTPPWSGRSPSTPASRSPSCGPPTGAGLEEMFLELTAATQREGAPA